MTQEICDICKRVFKEGDVPMLSVKSPKVHFDCWRAKYFAEEKQKRKLKRDAITESEHVSEEIDLKNRSKDNEYI